MPFSVSILISHLAKLLLMLLHLGGLTLFMVLLMLQQANEEKRTQFARLVSSDNLYSLPYNVGELLALIGLLSITIPTLLQHHNNKCEAISPGRMVFLALMLVLVGVAFTIRTPIPPGDLNNLGVGYLVLTQETQLISTYLIGMFTAFLGFLALFRAWPRTVILLLMMYLLYFSSGNILFNIHLKDNNTLLVLISSFTFLTILIGFIALWMLRPQIEKDYEQAQAFQALKHALQAREEELSDSEMVNTLLSFNKPSKKPKEEPKKEAIMMNMPASQPVNPPPPSNTNNLPEDVRSTHDALKALREEIDTLRQEHQAAEKEKLEQLTTAIDDLHDRINRTLIGG